MKKDKELYQHLRTLPWPKLWREEVPAFNQAAPRERMERVALIRAVGVVFREAGDHAQQAEVKQWLVGLLQDPQEKVRRYALAAIPKLGGAPGAEQEMISALHRGAGDRERTYIGKALGKIGGTRALDEAEAGALLEPRTEQKIKAAVARQTEPGEVDLAARHAGGRGLRIHLRCRRGLEPIVREELDEFVAAGAKLRVLETGKRLVALSPTAPFSLGELYRLRCFAQASIVLGTVRDLKPGREAEALARIVTSPLARELMKTFTRGPVRYRLNFIDKGHQRGLVSEIAERAYEACPELLNDARGAKWSIDLHPYRNGVSVELRPRLAPDPRLAYRQDDIPAASHPPLAACMARLAGKEEQEVVWDPFCGSGLELIERAMRGGVVKMFGSDTDPGALDIAKANLAAAKLGQIPTTLVCRDFREHLQIPGLRPGSVSLIVTNPPMGRRIRVPDLQGLIADLFTVAAKLLKPGGRLIFPNPVRLEPADPSLKLHARQVIDLGGFDCRLEIYTKQATPKQVSKARAAQPAPAPIRTAPDPAAGPQREPFWRGVKARRSKVRPSASI